MEVRNTGGAPTFSSRDRVSIFDLTISSARLEVHHWRVTDTENLNDHRNITYIISNMNSSRAFRTQEGGWSIRNANWTNFAGKHKMAVELRNLTYTTGKAQSRLREACDDSFKKRRRGCQS